FLARSLQLADPGLPTGDLLLCGAPLCLERMTQALQLGFGLLPLGLERLEPRHAFRCLLLEAGTGRAGRLEFRLRGHQPRAQRAGLRLRPGAQLLEGLPRRLELLCLRTQLRLQRTLSLVPRLQRFLERAGVRRLALAGGLLQRREVMQRAVPLLEQVAMPRLQRRELAAGPRHLVTRRLEFRLEGIPFGSQRLEFGRPTRRGVLQAGPESCQLRLEGFDPPVRSLELAAERREFPTRCLCPLLGHPALLTLGVEL